MRRIETLREKEAIFCSTKEESAKIWKLLNNIGKSVPLDSWENRKYAVGDYNDGLCYEFFEWCSVKYYTEKGYTIIPAKEFLEDKTIQTEEEILLLL